jgi:colanic acid biosynthesis glycosyl transferase WcaI
MARVLVLTLLFPPDGVSTARLMGDVAEDLQRRGHDVTVLTTTPHYNVDVEAQARQPLRRRWGRLLQASTYAGIPVLHVPMPRKGRSRLLRVAAWLWFHAVSALAGVVALPWRPDVVLTPSPPLTMGVASWALAGWWRAPFVYNVQEIHPDILVSLGMIRAGPIVWILEAVERFVYRHAGAITVIVPSAERRLLEKGVPPDRVQVVPNFVDIEAVTPEPRPNAFSRAHRLDGVFVVTYAGNFGPAQQLTTVLHAARLLADEPGVRLLLVGGGIEWDRIAQDAAGLDNVRVLPYQPFAAMPAIYGATDVALVPLAGGAGLQALPSKVYQIMGCGLPLVAIADAASDLATLVREAGSGGIAVPGSAESLAGILRAAARDPERWRALGRAGRAHVLQHYSRGYVADRYDAIVRGLTTAEAVA